MGPRTERDPGRRHRAKVRRANWPKDLEIVRTLFREYRGWLAAHRNTAIGGEPGVRAGLDLVDRLVAELPGAYGPPKGEVLLWVEAEEVVACGALRELEGGLGEIKRLHVRPDYRGTAFGRSYVRTLLDRACELGYRRVRVDTLPTMVAAVEFYREAGFRPIPGYWPHPVAGALFFEKDLDEPAAVR